MYFTFGIGWTEPVPLQFAKSIFSPSFPALANAIMQSRISQNYSFTAPLLIYDDAML